MLHQFSGRRRAVAGLQRRSPGQPPQNSPVKTALDDVGATRKAIYPYNRTPGAMLYLEASPVRRLQGACGLARNAKSLLIAAFAARMLT